MRCTKRTNVALSAFYLFVAGMEAPSCGDTAPYTESSGGPLW